MLRFVIRKMLSKKWMILSLLIGNILLVSITAGNPMYTQAVLQRTLTKNLEACLTEDNIYPGLATFHLDGTKDKSFYFEGEEQSAKIAETFGLEAVETLRYSTTRTAAFRLQFPRDEIESISAAVTCLTDLPEHIELLGGRMYSDGPDEEGVIDVIVTEMSMVKMNLLMDEVLTTKSMKDPEGNPVKIRVAGVFRNSADDDMYWIDSPSTYRNDFFMHPDVYTRLFLEGEDIEKIDEIKWHVMLDYTAMRGDDAERLSAIDQDYASAYQENAKLSYSANFSDVLSDYLKTAKKVTTTLWVLQAPIFMLLAAFIFMVSRQMLDMERDEIAVLKSRGAGKSQILGMYMLQSTIISVAAFAAGLPLGVYICQVVGSANAFLEFVRRSALPVEITAQSLTFAAAASVFSICAMVLPAFGYSKTTIVNQKQRKNKKSEKPAWQKLWLDVILLAVAVYGLYSFNGQKDMLAARVQQGASLDPLLFLSSSLFMVGAGLLAVRLMPVIVWLIFRPLRRFWSPALYASFLRVLRSRASHGFIMVFLIMTIALGLFNAQAARTINQNTEDNLHYAVGADVVLKEKWLDNSMIVAQVPDTDMIYYEPDIGRYETLDGIENMATVYVNDEITVKRGDGKLEGVRLMAIHTKDFGETAWFKDSLSDVHWYNYLNAISQNSRAVLVSKNFQTKYGARLGDTINYYDEADNFQRGIVYGFVDYFPGYLPTAYELNEDGLFKETEKFLIVANLQQIQSSWGVMPYEIWIDNKDTSAYLYEFAEANEVVFEKFEDVSAEVVGSKNDPVLQGTNGILTVGFIVVLVLCSVGFLIYWILSIKSRSLQFGIFRAMGMSMREVIVMLLNEQLYISGMSIAVGALVGHLTAKLYMPLIQIAYSSSDNVLPLELISRSSDSIRLFSVIGVVMLVCMVILGGLISRMKIAQALKLGED